MLFKFVLESKHIIISILLLQNEANIKIPAKGFDEFLYIHF